MADSNQKNSFPNPADSDETVNFAVMPQSNDDYSRPESGAPQRISDAEEPEHHGIWGSKSTYTIIGILVLFTLGALAYFLLWSDGGSDSGSSQTNSSRLPNVFFQQYFGAASCTDEAVCGEDADPDQDGLSNYDEFVERTDPTNPDHDSDGLADGDEVNIFLTNPLSKYTDPRPSASESDYSDSTQIKNEYDPHTPGLKMTEARLAQIQNDTAKYGLHEPTLTTMKTVTPEPKTVNVSIVNNKFDLPTVTIRVNDTVTWLNKDAANHQIASDPHPTHTGLPDLESGLLATNQTFSFKFTEAGTFTYHDHLNPSIKGTVIVE